MSTVDVAAALADIRVLIAEMSGNVGTLGAELRGVLQLHDADLARLKRKVDDDHEPRIGSLETSRSKLVGVASAAALLSSGATAGVMQALGRLA